MTLLETSSDLVVMATRTYDVSPRQACGLDTLDRRGVLDDDEAGRRRRIGLVVAGLA